MAPMFLYLVFILPAKIACTYAISCRRFAFFPQKNNRKNQPYRNAFVRHREICTGSNPSYGGHARWRRVHPPIHGDAQPHPHDNCHPPSQGCIECVPGTECGMHAEWTHKQWTHAERTHAVRPYDDIHTTATVRAANGNLPSKKMGRQWWHPRNNSFCPTNTLATLFLQFP